MNGVKSRNFDVAHGVIQSNVLSTTLSVLNVDSLLKEIQKLGNGVDIYVDGRHFDDLTITDLAYADDVTVVTDTAAGNSRNPARDWAVDLQTDNERQRQEDANTRIPTTE